MEKGRIGEAAKSIHSIAKMNKTTRRLPQKLMEKLNEIHKVRLILKSFISSIPIQIENFTLYLITDDYLLASRVVTIWTKNYRKYRGHEKKQNWNLHIDEVAILFIFMSTMIS